ncbi:hypothetical protein RQP46_005361 [Phenoliferia psychrophenolica]
MTSLRDQLYADREDFKDLVPIKQDDAPNALVPIAYAKEYRDAMDMFRALVQANEKSARGLELTEDLIYMNPGHYSVWAYRAQILLETKSDLSVELELMGELIKQHLKSYQVWQHRRTIVLALSDPSRELSFTSRALAIDSKNYHTWAYRQWVLCEFYSKGVKRVGVEKEVWEGERRYVEGLLEEDVRNNSAWNHRFFCEVTTTEEREGLLERELEFVKSKLQLAPNNPSAWNYLRGLLKTTSTPLASLTSFVAPFAVPPASASSESDTSSSSDSTFASAADDGKPSLPAFLAIEFLADACAEEAVRGKEQEKGVEAAALFNSLVQYDPIRTKYWQYRAAQAVRSKMTTDSRIPRPVFDALDLDLVLRVADQSLLHPLFAMWVPIILLGQTQSTSSRPYLISLLYFSFTLLYTLIPWSSINWTNKVWRSHHSRVLSFFGDDVYYYRCDLGNAEDIKRCLAAVREEVGQPTILINSSAAQKKELLTELSLDDVFKTFNINVLAPFALVKEILPNMLKIGRGHIVTVSSVVGLYGAAQLSAFSASQHALVGLHDSLRSEVKYRHGDPQIRTTLVVPGRIRATLSSSSSDPIPSVSPLVDFLAPAVNTHDVAKQIIAALETEQSREIFMPRIGGWLWVMKGLPSWASDCVFWLSGVNEARTVVRKAGKE